MLQNALQRHMVSGRALRDTSENVGIATELLAPLDQARPSSKPGKINVDAGGLSGYARGMTSDGNFEIFLVAAPGLERALFAEAPRQGFSERQIRSGRGDHQRRLARRLASQILEIRGAGRVMASLGSFPVQHLSQLDKRARRFAWRNVLRPDVPVRVEASCKASRIYHSGAAAERVERAINQELGCPISPDAEVCVRVRIENDLCSIGVDTSGELLHKRGHKEAVAKAPMRETMASLFLRQCGYDGNEPVVDPMCGSGTFVIEAAEIAAGLMPGRSRRFAFEQLATFDAAAWKLMRDAAASGLAPERREEAASGLAPERGERSRVGACRGAERKPRRGLKRRGTRVGACPERPSQNFRFYGSDRDAGAVKMSQANAERAGVSAITEFRQQPVSDLVAPDGPPGLVIVNPPYGTRIGEKQRLQPLYRALGQTLLTRFSGWRVGLIATDAGLAHATGLPFGPPSAPVSHGGLRVTLFSTGPLP